MLRTHHCGEITKKEIEKQVVLSGWVSNRRDHGGIIFIDLRDRYGVTQIVFDPKNDTGSHMIANDLKSEYVIQVEGTVRSRPKGQSNSNLKTGDIEIITHKITIFSQSKTPPFEIDMHANIANEEIRLKYRYIDMRRKEVLENIKFRSEFLHFTRTWFIKNDFLDVQTPIFTVSSPEGARDFLIPSRIYPGKFYSLPQAPQQYKQLLMVGGIDKYFQIAPCFRDEDPRADRHACEFYQIDCEMSFVEQEDIFRIVENYMRDVLASFKNKSIYNREFYRMSYKEAMNIYGSDRPDIRFGMEFVDLTYTFQKSEFGVFRNIANSENGCIKGMKLEGKILSRKDIDELTKIAQSAGASGLAYIVYENTGPKSPILKFLSQIEIEDIKNKLQPKPGDTIFFSANIWEKAVSILSVVRLALRDKFELADKNVCAFCWITDFPLFEEDEGTGKIDFCHNPFSMPKGGLYSFERQNILQIDSLQYDLVCNGHEILSGAIRNYDIDLLVKIFEKVGRTKKEVIEKFGAIYEAFQYGVPPHGGFAIGLDRLIMILSDVQNIREIYAFPKSGNAQDLMMNAPDYVEKSQLEELHIEVRNEEKEKTHKIG